MTKMNCGFRNIKVTLLDSGDANPFKMFWNWYRETWYSLRNQEYDYENPKHVAACNEVLAGTALPVPQEALNFQIRVEGISRVGLAQFTRGRVGWAYCVTSQMPERIEHETIIPKNIYEHPIFGNSAFELLKLSDELYDKMIEAGIPPQDCRYLTLHGQTTNLVCSVNFMALRGYFARRCENGLTDELNLIGRLIRRELIAAHLDENGKDKVPGSGWSVLLGKLDAMGGNKVCLNTDKVFGNTGRAKRANTHVPSLIDAANQPDWKFEKSAWFYELLELPDDLLFPGEAEMIQDWRTIGYEGRIHKIERAT